MEVMNLKHEARTEWLRWSLVIVLSLLTGVTVASTYLTLELKGSLDAMAEAPPPRPALPCGAIPTRLVLDHPECAQWLLESMNVTNVRIHPRDTHLPEMDRATAIMRNLTERYARWANPLDQQGRGTAG